MRRLLALCCVTLGLVGTACRSGNSVTLLDVHDGRRLSLAQAAPDLAKTRLVVVGESHDEPAHHRLQLDVIQALAAAGAKLAVGLEMFPAKAQKVLDDFASGRLDEQAFIPAFVAHWGHLWPQYRDIFLACREKGIPLVGLNVPRSVVHKVAREGFDALTEAERGELPMVACRVDSEYEALLRRAMGGHGGEGNFRYFCEAQVVWDTAMAAHALDYLKAHPDTVMVVLTGTVHAWKPAMPRQVRDLDPQLPLRVILPKIAGSIEPATIGPGECDYLAVAF